MALESASRESSSSTTTCCGNAWATPEWSSVPNLLPLRQLPAPVAPAPVSEVDESLLKCSPDENVDGVPWSQLGPRGGFPELNKVHSILRDSPVTGLEPDRWRDCNTESEDFNRSGAIFWCMEDRVAQDETLVFSDLNCPGTLRQMYPNFGTNYVLNVVNHAVMERMTRSDRHNFAHRLAVFVTRCCRHEAGKSTTFKLPTNRYGWVPFEEIVEAAQRNFDSRHIDGRPHSLHHLERRVLRPSPRARRQTAA